MKKTYLFLFLALALISCSDDEQNITVDNSAMLQKVVFYRNSPNECNWNFNNQGYLDNITKPDGTLIEKFKYDSNNNVVEDTKYSNGVVSETYLVTYNSSNIITQINNTNYSYDSATNRYFYNTSSANFSCQLNSDFLATHYTLEELSPANIINFQMSYTNGNMISFQKLENSVETMKREFTYENTVLGNNPLHISTLPVLKLKSLIDPSFFSIPVASLLPVETASFGSNNNQHYNYGWLINTNGRISSQTIEVYNGSSLVDSFIYTDYYYQN